MESDVFIQHWGDDAFRINHCELFRFAILKYQEVSVKYVANTSHAGHPRYNPWPLHSHKPSSYSPYAVATSASTNVTTNTCNEREQPDFNNHGIVPWAREIIRYNITRRALMIGRSRFYVPSYRRCLMPTVGPAGSFIAPAFLQRDPRPPPLLPTACSSSRSRNPTFVPTTVTITTVAITVKYENPQRRFQTIAPPPSSLCHATTRRGNLDTRSTIRSFLEMGTSPSAKSLGE